MTIPDKISIQTDQPGLWGIGKRSVLQVGDRRYRIFYKEEATDKPGLLTRLFKSIISLFTTTLTIGTTSYQVSKSSLHQHIFQKLNVDKQEYRGKIMSKFLDTLHPKKRSEIINEIAAKKTSKEAIEGLAGPLKTALNTPSNEAHIKALVSLFIGASVPFPKDFFTPAEQKALLDHLTAQYRPITVMQALVDLGKDNELRSAATKLTSLDAQSELKIAKELVQEKAKELEKAFNQLAPTDYAKNKDDIISRYSECQKNAKIACALSAITDVEVDSTIQAFAKNPLKWNEDPNDPLAELENLFAIKPPMPPETNEAIRKLRAHLNNWENLLKDSTPLTRERLQKLSQEVNGDMGDMMNLIGCGLNENAVKKLSSIISSLPQPGMPTINDIADLTDINPRAQSLFRASDIYLPPQTKWTMKLKLPEKEGFPKNALEEEKQGTYLKRLLDDLNDGNQITYTIEARDESNHKIEQNLTLPNPKKAQTAQESFLPIDATDTFLQLLQKMYRLSNGLAAPELPTLQEKESSSSSSEEQSPRKSAVSENTASAPSETEDTDATSLSPSPLSESPPPRESPSLEESPRSNTSTPAVPFDKTAQATIVSSGKNALKKYNSQKTTDKSTANAILAYASQTAKQWEDDLAPIVTPEQYHLMRVALKTIPDAGEESLEQYREQLPHIATMMKSFAPDPTSLNALANKTKLTPDEQLIVSTFLEYCEENKDFASLKEALSEVISNTELRPRLTKLGVPAAIFKSNEELVTTFTQRRTTLIDKLCKQPPETPTKEETDAFNQAKEDLLKFPAIFRESQLWENSDLAYVTQPLINDMQIPAFANPMYNAIVLAGIMTEGEVQQFLTDQAALGQAIDKGVIGDKERALFDKLAAQGDNLQRKNMQFASISSDSYPAYQILALSLSSLPSSNTLCVNILQDFIEKEKPGVINALQRGTEWYIPNADFTQFTKYTARAISNLDSLEGPYLPFSEANNVPLGNKADEINDAEAFRVDISATTKDSTKEIPRDQAVTHSYQLNKETYRTDLGGSTDFGKKTEALNKQIREENLNFFLDLYQDAKKKNAAGQ